MLFGLGPVLIMFAITHLAAVGAVTLCPDLSRSRVGACVTAGLVTGAVLAHVVLPDRPAGPCLAAGGLLLVACYTYGAARSALRPVGAALWVSWLAFAGVSVIWATLFLRSLSLSTPTVGLLWLTGLVAAVTLPSAVLTTREGWEPLLRWRWDRPRTPLAQLPVRPPRVSIHVPCHAEPPEMVMATLDRLAALDYPDFEVLVIDNNTTDPALWQPLQAHCAALGERFRFLHIEGLTGAKAGALNWALPHADPSAELIAIVDADYQVEPIWLRRTVGYFADQRMGFVQCPHAYRDYAHSRFGRWANAEYSVFFATGMVSLNEHNAGLTVGTLSLIRKQALQDAGGWAQWCLTEDSELAIRIHAAGYDSVYLTEKYGRGLIPETFSAYRKQRFRWTYGPVQEFRRHWRLFLPRALGAHPSQLTPTQKRHHANHGIDVICIGLRALTIPLGAATATSLLLHHEKIPVPVELWAASTAVLASSLTIRFLIYTRIVGVPLGRAVGGSIAFAALSFVIITASLRASVGRPATWQRTGKFSSAASGLGVLRQVKAETGLGLLCLSAAALILALAPTGGVITMLAVALVTQAATFLAATVIALAADRVLPQPVATPAKLRRHQPRHLATRAITDSVWPRAAGHVTLAVIPASAGSGPARVALQSGQ